MCQVEGLIWMLDYTIIVEYLKNNSWNFDVRGQCGEATSLQLRLYHSTSLSSPLFFCVLSCRLIQRLRSLEELSPRWVELSACVVHCLQQVGVCVECFSLYSELMLCNLMNMSTPHIIESLSVIYFCEQKPSQFQFVDLIKEILVLQRPPFFFILEFVKSHFGLCWCNVLIKQSVSYLIIERLVINQPFSAVN